jgi:nitrate reductase NapAB chaperone NapD
MKAYMGLTCKPGAYNEVLKKLLFKLGVDQQNMFLLFGPVDILLMFTNLPNVEEFVKRWVNPIRLIGAEDDLITKTMSLIVSSEGPSLAEKPFAFLLLNTKPQSTEDVKTKLLTLPEVLSADVVLGPFDVICSIKAENHEDLETSVLLIQQIDGLTNSVTSIISPIKVLPDW